MKCSVRTSGAFVSSEVNLHLSQGLFKNKLYMDLWMRMLES